MTDEIRKKRTMVRKQYNDDADIPRVVLVPEHETDLRKGIPVSLDLTPLFGHMPSEFQQVFYAELHKQGLIEPKDWLKRDALERYQRAMRTVIRHDFLNILALVNEEVKHV